jgi:osmotically inducible protein OsmC
MPTRKAEAVWNGDLKKGKGNMAFGSGAFEGSYSYKSRFEEGTGTNPEELIGAAHAGCFSMALSGALAKAGANPESINTEASVTLDAKKGITTIELHVKGDVPGIDQETFKKHAEDAKENCPVSKALKGVTIKVNAELNQ